MSNSIEYTQLYIIGDAVATGWDLGQAPDMTSIAPGVLEWTGELNGGKEFKFMNTREAWHKHIVATASGITAEPEASYSLAFMQIGLLMEVRIVSLKLRKAENIPLR